MEPFEANFYNGGEPFVGQYVMGFDGVKHLESPTDSVVREVRLEYVEASDHQLCVYDVACGPDQEKENVTKKA